MGGSSLSDESYSRPRAVNGELGIPHGNAICYSGYRDGQNPFDGSYPSPQEIREDLLILAKNWKYLRVYDSGRHAEMVLETIQKESLDFQVLLGMGTSAEMSNPDCPWGADYGEDMLAENRKRNDSEATKAIALCERYGDLVCGVSVGNEATVDWTDHLVPVERLIEFSQRIRSATGQKTTFCENYVPWTNKLQDLAAELDFLSVHSYPVWEYTSIDEALEYTRQNYHAVASLYPDKPVVITEAGWATASNGRGIEPANASEELQAGYYRQLHQWTTEAQILCFVFEAFDEPWKGSPDPLEPEKHWGLFKVDRTPKLVMQELYA